MRDASRFLNCHRPPQFISMATISSLSFCRPSANDEILCLANPCLARAAIRSRQQPLGLFGAYVNFTVPRASRTSTRSRPQADDMQLLRMIWEIPRFWRSAVDRRLKPMGLSDAKWRTILHLSHGPKGMNQVELANRLNIEAPTLARLLDRMTNDGWLERRTAATDRRVKTVHLLPKAASVIRQIDRGMSETQIEILGGLSRAELRACQATVSKIHARAERAAHVAKEK